jgi:hypothetical protein
MVARATEVSGVVGPRVYKVTGVVGEPSDTLAWFPGCWLVHVDWTDSNDRESGCSEFLGCASLGAAHGGRGTIRTVTGVVRSHSGGTTGVNRGRVPEVSKRVFSCKRGKQGEGVDVVDFPDKGLKMPSSKLYTIH